MKNHDQGGHEREKDKEIQVLTVNDSLKANLTPEMYAELEETFILASDSGHSHIPFARLPLALKALGMNFNEIDTTRIPADGITFEKFVELALLCLKHPNWAANEMHEIFVLFDKDQSGNIDPNELRRVFTRYGENLTEVELEDQLREFDMDGDAQVKQLTI